LLAGDIAALDNRSPNETSDSDGILASLSGLTEVGEIAGMLYVVEGSALGGQVLMKVLQRSAGVTPEVGASFFLPHGESPQLRWAEYVQLLACLPTTSASEQDTVQGAVTTFNALHDWVERKWRG
jgi:heme oxygenase